PRLHATAPEPVPEVAAPQWGNSRPGPLLRTPWLRWLAPLSGEQRCVAAFCASAALLFLPSLGATAWWAPWEPPYGAVARELLARWRRLLGPLDRLTPPLFGLLARRAVPGPLCVGLLSGAMACLSIVLFAEGDGDGAGWAIAFYCFVGLATLGKGLLGFALPG